MTIVKENFLTKGLSGNYDGKVVFRQWQGRTIFAKPPRRRSAPTANQVTRKELFLKAVDYASIAMQNPELKEAYRKMAPLGSSAYNMAVADFLVPPKVNRIETGGYNGEPGSLITVAAQDNCKVQSVVVSITQADGTLVEEGAAVMIAGNRVWIYTATAANPEVAGSVITATAFDVPNHQGSASETL